MKSMKFLGAGIAGRAGTCGLLPIKGLLGVAPNARELFMQPMEALAVVREQAPAVLPALFTVQRPLLFKVE